MLFVVNIISRTRGSVYDEVALNRFPIVYINDDISNADDLFADIDFKNIIMKYISNTTVFNNAKVCARAVADDEGEWTHADTEYILNEKITNDEYGEYVKSNMGDDSK